MEESNKLKIGEKVVIINESSPYVGKQGKFIRAHVVNILKRQQVINELLDMETLSDKSKHEMYCLVKLSETSEIVDVPLSAIAKVKKRRID